MECPSDAVLIEQFNKSSVLRSSVIIAHGKGLESSARIGDIRDHLLSFSVSGISDTKWEAAELPILTT